MAPSKNTSKPILFRSILSISLVPWALLLCLCPRNPARESLTTPGVIREFPASLEEIRQAVLAVVGDKIVHGTLVFDKEPILTGAEAVDSTSLFDPWEGPGEVYFKIRKNAIA